MRLRRLLVAAAMTAAPLAGITALVGATPASATTTCYTNTWIYDGIYGYYAGVNNTESDAITDTATGAGPSELFDACWNHTAGEWTLQANVNSLWVGNNTTIAPVDIDTATAGGGGPGEQYVFECAGHGVFSIENVLTGEWVYRYGYDGFTTAWANGTNETNAAQFASNNIGTSCT